MHRLAVWWEKNRIVGEELIRAGATFPLWCYGLWYLQNTGLLTASTLSLVALAAGVSALQFAVLVTFRKRSGSELKVTRIRYVLVPTLVLGVAIFIWRMSEGEVIRAIVFLIMLSVVAVLTFRFAKRRGMRW